MGEHQLHETNRRGNSYRVVLSHDNEPGAFKRVDEDGNAVSRRPASEGEEHPVEQHTSDAECVCGEAFGRWGEAREHLLEMRESDDEAVVGGVER